MYNSSLLHSLLFSHSLLFLSPRSTAVLCLPAPPLPLLTALIFIILHLLSLPPPPLPSLDINAQARKLQRNRAKGTLTLPRHSNSSFCRSLSETSLNQVGLHAEAKADHVTIIHGIVITVT